MAVKIKSGMKIKTRSPSLARPLFMSLITEILGNAD